MMLPRRWVRQLSYGAGFLVFAAALLLIANRKRIIHLDDILPAQLVPEYFQPPSDAYVVDVAIGDCTFFSKHAGTCGIPAALAGLYGDVGTAGGWSRVNKDLLLDSHWTAKRYLSVKTVLPQYYEAHRENVVLDVAVAAASDCRIPRNKKCVPEIVLKQLNTGHVFDGDDLSALLEANKGTKPKLKSDSSKAASTYNEKYEKEKAKEKAAVKAEKEKEAEKATPPGVKEDFTDFKLRKRVVETSRHDLKATIRVVSDKELLDAGWVSRGHGIWLKYGPATDNAVTGIDVLFGDDAVDPRPNWNLIPYPLLDLGSVGDRPPHLTVRKGQKLNYKSKQFQPSVKFNKDGKLKVLQVSDLHFSTGFGKCRDPVPETSGKNCRADLRTLKFIREVLDIEKPDFVVLTGDQVFGQAAPDPETALFKAVSPFIERKIPFGIVLGNHDDESNLSRQQMMHLAASLPYLTAAVGPENVDGFGNFRVVAENFGNNLPGAVFYFMDSHSYSKQPKTNPGYDWFKESQIVWLEELAQEFKDSDNAFNMAFFHIPLPEYRNTNQPLMGQQKEGVAASKYQTDMRNALGRAGVQIASCGHDHANDYCVADTQKKDDKENLLWLCYGGGAGEGGYGGYGGYIRRVRVYELDASTRSVLSWKRAENDPGQTFDQQKLVEDGKVVNHV